LKKKKKRDRELLPRGERRSKKKSESVQEGPLLSLLYAKRSRLHEWREKERERQSTVKKGYRRKRFPMWWVPMFLFAVVAACGCLSRCCAFPRKWQGQ
jgi:hypothetical protein